MALKNFELQIIRVSAPLFAKNGVAKVCPDDVIGQTGCDTRLFYKHFPTKEDLLRAVVQHYLETASRRLKVCGAVSPNAVFELQHFFDQMQSGLANLSPVFVAGLKTDYPDIYKLLLTGRTLLLSFLETNYQRGVREGFYAGHVKAQHVINWYVSQIQAILFDRSNEYAGGQSEAVSFSNRFFLRLSVNDAGQRMISYHRPPGCQDESRVGPNTILPS
ncbi:TetR/AcrR family transcriptional regulator [Dyadobacter sp. OTU695]|uniref:TetR/AcrR family transcriptional regulator n=1 Tax=Dyadobacter sp. OTU695 TaxID=3043860 RepID=UPI00313D88B8